MNCSVNPLVQNFPNYKVYGLHVLFAGKAAFYGHSVRDFIWGSDHKVRSQVNFS